MATGSNTKKPCCKCNKGGATFICDGCHLAFCLQHASEHRQELSLQMDNIGQQHDILKRNIDGKATDKVLLDQIDRWEKEKIDKIRSMAETARNDLNRLTEESKNRLNDLMDKLSSELRTHRQSEDFTEDDLKRWTKEIEQLEQELLRYPKFEFIHDDVTMPICLIRVKNSERTEKDQVNSVSDNEVCSDDKSNKIIPSGTPISVNHTTLNEAKPSSKTYALLSPSSSFPGMTFGLNTSSDPKILRLFEHLMLLHPMDKNGPMRGKCHSQTVQMENFLGRTFGFRNILGKYIVQGVKWFQLDTYPHAMNPNLTIDFPSSTANSFVMTVKEIMEWQRSYRVYTYKSIKGMNKEFLHRALQGKSQDGEEAFRMKFVVRISTCPILMEFDAKVISRKLEEDWPHRIKLVSVTGIDFADRKHDVWDILYYVSNWKEVFEVDHLKNEPALFNERDFLLKRGGPSGKLHQDCLYADLADMARLRLLACDKEGVQIVVETGIGLEVFSGIHIGVDENVRITSALAIRTVLENDGPSYKNICAIVFALPIMDENKNTTHIHDTFSAFVDKFQEPQYNGPIPVLIADQDMHRLTVAIARQGFIVSQLNPADSHGVFGEYWQNREPAVEEKLALTTLGLLVQHHFINPYVLDTNNYYLV